MKYIYRIIFFVPLVIAFNFAIFMTLVFSKETSILDHELFDKIRDLCDY